MKRADDAVGATLAACGVIDTYYFEWSEFGPMPRWIAEIEALLATTPVLDAPETELHVYSTLLIAMLYGQPGHPMLAFCVQRVTDMLARHRCQPADGSGYFLVELLLAHERIAKGYRSGRPGAAAACSSRSHTVEHLWWRTRLGYFLWNATEYELSLAMLDEADRLAAATRV